MTIIETYEEFIKAKVSGGSRRPGLHVSDIVSDCLLKPWYRMAGTDTGELDKDSITNFYYGTTVHESFDGMFDVMEYHMCVNPFAQITENELIINIDKEFKSNPFQWVSGSLDAIYNGDTILDFKTCKKLPSKPSESYVRQINYYSYMYYMHTGIEIKKGAILYLEKQSGFKEKKLFEFELEDLETNRLKMMRAMDIIGAEEMPAKEPYILCTVCPFRPTCKPTGFFDYIEKKMVY